MAKITTVALFKSKVDLGDEFTDARGIKFVRQHATMKLDGSVDHVIYDPQPTPEQWRQIFDHDNDSQRAEFFRQAIDLRSFARKLNRRFKGKILSSSRRAGTIDSVLQNGLHLIVAERKHTLSDRTIVVVIGKKGLWVNTIYVSDYMPPESIESLTFKTVAAVTAELKRICLKEDTDVI